MLPRATGPLFRFFQQGFVPGRRIYASYLFLDALIEKSRLSKRRLYMCFVNVKRAFSSVRRETLLQKLFTESVQMERRTL